MRIIIAIAFLFILSSCKKEYDVPTSLANINVVHAVVNVPELWVNTSKKAGTWKGLTLFTSRMTYGGLPLNNPVVADTNTLLRVAKMTDTLNPVYTSPAKFNIAPGDVYTLFLSGTDVAVESTLIKEQLVRQPDSTTAVRFINLVSNSTPVSVRIKNATGTEVASLAYKQLSEFKVYDAKMVNSTYIFEVTDAATSNVLFTYNYVVARTYNVTLALRGLSGGTGTNAINITRVNHY